MPPARNARAPWWAYGCLAASMALVGSYVGLSKLLVAVFPVFLLAWLRFGIAALAMLGWLRRAPGEEPLSPRDLRLLFWESFLGNFLFSICMLFGVALTSAVAAGVIMAAIPAAVALLSLTRGGAPMPSGAGTTSWLGNLLLLGAVLCEASYVVIGKQLTAKVSARRISALVNLWGLALVTPLGAWVALSYDFNAVPTGLWALLVFYALAASMVTVWLWMTGLRHVPAASAGVFTVMLPISAAAVGVGLLGEPFGSGHVAALVMALLGLLLATWPARGTRAA